MKIVFRYFISLCACLSTYVVALPPIVHPSLTLLLNGDIPTNLTHKTTTHDPFRPFRPSPPPPPFPLPVPSSPLRLNVDYVRYVPARTEHWVREALYRAWVSCAHHPHSQSIARSIPETVIGWNGNPDLGSTNSTDIELEPDVRLTWGMFAGCLGVMQDFVTRYPGWDFGFEIEELGEAGDLGKCTCASR